MNEIQRKVLMGVGVIVLFMLIYPPYQIYRFKSLIDSGYAFLFDLPHTAIVDVTTLLIQWVGVLIVGAIVFFSLKDK
jgi:hypothetical protein